MSTKPQSDEVVDEFVELLKKGYAIATIIDFIGVDGYTHLLRRLQTETPEQIIASNQDQSA